MHGNQLNLKTIDACDAYPLHASKSAKIAADILMRLFKHIDTHILIRLWNGLTFVVGSAQQKNLSPAFTLVIHQPKVIRLLVINNNPMLLAQSYFNGNIDIEGNFFAAIGLKNVHLMALLWHDKLSIFFKAISLPNENQHHQYQLMDTKHYFKKNIKVWQAFNIAYKNRKPRRSCVSLRCF